MLSGEIQVSNGAYSLSVAYDTITNNVIRIREFEGDYTLTVTAEDHHPQTLSLAADELYTYLNQPLIVELSIDATENIAYIDTFAGNGEHGDSGDGQDATEASFENIIDVAIDSQGDIYIADSQSNKIRKVDSTGRITTQQIDVLISPRAIAFDNNDFLYIVNEAYSDRSILKVNLYTGQSSVVAGGNGEGHSGDGGLATEAQLHSPYGIALDASGNLYISEYYNHRIRKVDSSTGIITTVAGTGVAGYNGDGIPAIEALINSPFNLDVDEEGNIYFPDALNHRIRRVDAQTGIISTIAGTGTSGYRGDGELAISAYLHAPKSISLDGFGNVFFSSANHVVRKINEHGVISTIAGTGLHGFAGDGGLANEAQFYSPMGIALDFTKTIYVADVNNKRVRKIYFE